jgi:hypothetical protein
MPTGCEISTQTICQLEQLLVGPAVRSLDRFGDARRYGNKRLRLEQVEAGPSRRREKRVIGSCLD